MIIKSECSDIADGEEIFKKHLHFLSFSVIITKLEIEFYAKNKDKFHFDKETGYLEPK